MPYAGRTPGRDQPGATRQRRRQTGGAGSRFELGFPGDHSEGATPVPIPNTEVKPLSAENTALSGRGKIGHRRDLILKSRPRIRRRRDFVCTPSAFTTEKKPFEEGLELAGLGLVSPNFAARWCRKSRRALSTAAQSSVGCGADQFASAANPCRSIASAQAMHSPALSTFCMWIVTTRFSPTST